MTTIAIIGTAGRDKTKPMTKALWSWMITDVLSRVPKGAELVSGGAAWADHLAVYLFLSGHASKLTLHLPAPLVDGKFEGPSCSSGNVATYYHRKFSQVIGENNTMRQIEQAGAMKNCTGSFQPAAWNYQAMFVRNAIVAAQADEMLAYTFGPGDKPADGGTASTWNMCRGKRTHVSLPYLEN